MAVVKGAANSISIVFAKFAYKDVDVKSNTLLTVILEPQRFLGYKYVSFIVTDEKGNILNEVKYQEGTSKFKISSTGTFEGKRINVLLIYANREDTDMVPYQILGLLHIKKGSLWDMRTNNIPVKPLSPLSVKLKNADELDNWTFSTDYWGSSDYWGVDYSSAKDTTELSTLQFSYSQGSKLFLQVQRNNQTKYNFFDIPEGASSLELDVTKCTKPSIAKTISSGGSYTDLYIYGRTDENFYQKYSLAHKQTYSSQATYYIPAESFQEYLTSIHFKIGGVDYFNNYKGATIPDVADPIDAKIRYSGSTLADFKPQFNGSYDYYHASFVNKPFSISIDFYSPAASNNIPVQMPDLGKYIKGLDWKNLLLDRLALTEVDGFQEDKLLYLNALNYTYSGPQTKSVSINLGVWGSN